MSGSQNQTENLVSKGDIVFKNSSVENSESDEVLCGEIGTVQKSDCMVAMNERDESGDKEEVHHNQAFGVREIDTGNELEADVTFDELSLGESSSVSEGPGYKSLINPKEESSPKRSASDASDDEARSDHEARSHSSGSSFDSSSSSDYSTGSSRRECSEDTSQDLRLRPKKITLSLDLRDTSSEASLTDNSDVTGILRKDRTKRSSTTDNTFNSCNDVTQISSEESLSALTDGSSASEFRGSDREDSLPMSSDSVSTRCTTDVESGGIKDTRNRSRTGLAAGFVSLFGLGRFWLSPAKPKCRVRFWVFIMHATIAELKMRYHHINCRYNSRLIKTQCLNVSVIP